MFFLVDLVLLSLRALGVAAVFHAAGITIFLWLFGGELSASVGVLRRIVRMTAAGGVALTMLEYFLLPARMAGAFGGAFDPSLQQLLAESSLAGAYGARLAGMALIFLSLEMLDRVAVWLGLAGAVVAVLSFGLMGHTVIHPFRWTAGLLLLSHVGIAVFWFGALVPLYAIVGAEPHVLASRVIAGFSAMASYLVPGLALFGVMLVGLMLNSAEDLASGYGVMLMVKVAGFALLLRLAAWNKWRWSPGVARGDPAAALGLQRSVAAEWLIMIMVVATTVVMTSLFSPGYLVDPLQTGELLH